MNLTQPELQRVALRNWENENASCALVLALKSQNKKRRLSHDISLGYKSTAHLLRIWSICIMVHVGLVYEMTRNYFLVNFFSYELFSKIFQPLQLITLLL